MQFRKLHNLSLTPLYVLSKHSPKSDGAHCENARKKTPKRCRLFFLRPIFSSQIFEWPSQANPPFAHQKTIRKYFLSPSRAHLLSRKRSPAYRTPWPPKELSQNPQAEGKPRLSLFDILFSNLHR